MLHGRLLLKSDLWGPANYRKQDAGFPDAGDEALEATVELKGRCGSPVHAIKVHGGRSPSRGG